MIKDEGCFVGGDGLITGDLSFGPGMTDRMRKTQPLREQQTHHDPHRDGGAASLSRCVMIHRWVHAMHSLVGACSLTSILVFAGILLQPCISVMQKPKSEGRDAGPVGERQHLCTNPTQLRMAIELV